MLKEEAFHKMREKVLSQWHSGKGVRLDEAIDYHRSFVREKNCALLYKKAKKDKVILFSGWSSTGDINEQIRRHKIMQKESDVCNTSVDSYTRALRFEDIERLMKKGELELNGFPIVNYGVRQSRRIVEEIRKPEHLRIGAPDARLVAEIGFAAGFSGFVTQPLGDFAYYCKDTPIEEVMRDYSYVYRLIGIYEDAGAPIVIDSNGLGKTGLPIMSLQIATNIIHALIAAEEGVKNIALKTHPCGHFVHDAAALRLIIPLCDEYLERLGYKNVEVTQFCLPTVGPYPEDESQTYGILCLVAATVALAGRGVVQRIGARSIAEGRGIPMPEDVNKAFRAQRQVINMVNDQRFHFDCSEIEKETEIIEMEARSILDKIVVLGKGDIVSGSIAAVRGGIIDEPFPSNKRVAGKVMVARDATGIVRWLNTGNLPFSNQIKEINRKKLSEREKIEGKKINIDVVSKDLLAAYKGQGLLGK